MAKEKEDNISEEETKGEENTPLKAKGGKRGLIKWVIVGVIALIFAGGGVYGYKVFSKKDSGHNAENLNKEPKEKQGPAQMVPIDPFVVNLADSNEIKYLKISINLEVDSAKVNEEALLRMPQIRDTILMLLTSKTSEDVKDIGGKLKLQDELVSRINHYLSEGKVKAVYFTEFVMQ